MNILNVLLGRVRGVRKKGKSRNRRGEGGRQRTKLSVGAQY